ncbi:hypothetical protein ACFVH6_11950 [Spirillospora sp. NPDC127200]
MNQSETPVLDALAAYHRRGMLPFTPPGHKQGRGADRRAREVLGEAVFGSDVLVFAGLDDRRSSNAEMLTPYPPGIPAVLPGERVNEPVLEYLRTGVAAGMVVPDAADTAPESVRVPVED